MYITYMFSQTHYLATDRRAHFSYINPNGTLGESNNINNDINREGFTSCAVDPYTPDPFVIWHAITKPDGSYDSPISYFLYHVVGGMWRTPFIVIDNPEISEPLTGHSNDEFIWPQIWIGPSPEIGHRRVHAYANNFTLNSAGRGNYNSIYLSADFDDLDLLANSDLEWTVQSFPYFDILHYNNIARVSKDMIVSEIDGKIILFGSLADSLFILYSNDYGETFTKYTQQLKQPLQNPTNIYTGDPVWLNDDETPAEMYIVPSNDLSHFNGIFTDEFSKVQWMSGVNYNSQESIDSRQYMSQYIYPKIFSFDTEIIPQIVFQLSNYPNPFNPTTTISFSIHKESNVELSIYKLKVRK